MSGITQSSKGSIREVFTISYPIFLALLSSCIMGFCDRYFLSKYSLDAFQGACIGGYLVLLFQAFCMQITSINQIFISGALGKKQEGLIGPYTWQMIWGSVLISLVMIPIGLLTNHFYFSKTPIQALGSQYFLVLIMGNCLFSLGATFAGFQAGIGKTKLLTFSTVISNICNIILNYILIFGIQGTIPPLGVIGAAIGTLISQGVYCLILFASFIYHKDSSTYQSKKWSFSIPLFLKLIRIGVPSAFARFSNLLYWAFAVKILSNLEGDYLLVLSYGATLWFPISTITEALAKGALSFFSFFLGANHFPLIWTTLRSALFIFFIAFFLLGIPLVLFSESLINTVLQTTLSQKSLETLKMASIWLWIYFLLEGVSRLIIIIVLAMKQTLFSMKYNIITGGFLIFLPYYLCFHAFHCNADKVWMANWICCFVSAVVFFGKAYIELNKNKEPTFSHAPS